MLAHCLLLLLQLSVYLSTAHQVELVRLKFEFCALTVSPPPAVYIHCCPHHHG
ncbi:hypothetical protein BOX15_Mlig002342g1 [Macrostomum lignano]|uniref:Uncharacterized protein n=1 Tax=Macrostomum lignano TaxID=282301 RepID=A0A267E869_9PLAT|nr:hypothetical protein BOX15_Mlig002342g3 [Macrostomum lignano]PAA60536.1 hypothetical protein BOX15_Mlig002342g2 [Macrostomum lignano]PAA67821.1 hypothetical protein BOX15_Mlig002342g1 [Macrostomum lignano]